MRSRLGLEIGARSVRAVRLDGAVRRSMRALEVPWDGGQLDEPMRRIQAELGPARHVGVAIDLPHLLVKEIALPALPASGKVAVVSLEPERYFPVRGEELVVTARARDGLVVAARERTVTGVLDAVAVLGALDRVESSPHAVARALASLGVRSGTVLLRPLPRGSCVLRLDGGALAGVRWIYDESSVAAAVADGARPLYAAGAGGDAAALPAPPGIDERFLAAFGAALGVGEPLGETLVTPDALRRIAMRRRRRMAAAVAAAAAAVVLMLAAFDRAADRTARELRARADSLATAAEGAVALQSLAAALDRQERGAAAAEQSRMQPLAMLAALGRRLPADAHLRTLRVTASEWQIDGYARDAARLVPLLEAAPEFEQVRFLAATTTERLGAETHESFSIAFRLARQP